MEQIVQQAMEQNLLRVAKQLEDQLDSELHKLDNLQDDDVERIRQRRIMELKQQQEKTKEWIANGHGEYKEIHEEKEFFKEMKGEERMICHFYRDNWPCKVGRVVG
jgi:HD superfamily phosphohydrolase